MSAPRTLSRPRRRKAKRSSRRRHMSSSGKTRLSDLWNPTVATEVGRQVVGAAIGGGAWGMMERMMPMNSPGQKLLYGGVAGFVTGALFKMPNIGCGIVGAATYSALKDSGFMADGESENTYVRNMDQMPLMLMNDQPIDPAMGMAMLSDAMPQQYYIPQYATPYNEVYY